MIALVLSLALPRVARAQEDEPKKAAVLEEARQHVAKAKVHYDLGEFKEAADEYIIVYRLRPIPALLFNIAQAYRQGGLYDKARQFYKSYLRESPNAANKALIEQNIREMDDLLAKERRTREAAPTGVKEPAEATLPVQQKVADAAKPVEPKPVTPAPKPVETAPQPIAAAPVPPPVKPAVTQQQPAAKPPMNLAMATPPKPSAPVAATSSNPTRAPVAEEGGSILTKWWLWTAVGVVAVGAGVAAMTMGGNSPPASHFPTTPVFP
ncbi:MAG: tetratricopeptide repeat protein [Myxococcales bacterium]|nr:tetratricopeptide repeat protein [Myxococcales bacterium]